MATITIRREYEDGEILFGSDIDAIIEDIETFLNTTRINDDNIQNSGITASDKLVDATVTASKLASNAVTTTKIMDSNVTTAKIADSNVTTAKIADSNVTTAKIADDGVTKAKIAADVAGLGLAQNADGSLEIDVDDSTVEVSADVLRVKDAGIVTAKIADGAVSRIKLTGGVSIFTTTLNASPLTMGTHVFSGRPVMYVLFSGDLPPTHSEWDIYQGTPPTTRIFRTGANSGRDFGMNPLFSFVLAPTAGSFDIIATVNAATLPNVAVTLAIIEL